LEVDRDFGVFGLGYGEFEFEGFEVWVDDCCF